MFSSLRQRLGEAFRSLSGGGRLTEENLKQALRQVKLSLLEADVNYRVVKRFVSRVKEKCLSAEHVVGTDPAHVFVKAVHDELVEVMGGSNREIDLGGAPPVVIMLVGLQGSGKTTTAGKLANHLRKRRKRKPMLVAADVYRPAAIDQLETIGRQLSIPVYSDRSGADPVRICEAALKNAYSKDVDTVILDTAGRLHIDDAMMAELERIQEAVSPREILLVVDAMTGQEAVSVAQEFHSRLGIGGCILTKLDGDARGGAALSILEVTGAPVKYVGVGEKLDAIEPFHPERMASRILGMGDVLSLVDKVEEAFDESDMRRMQERVLASDFNLQDFLDQLKSVRRLGSLADLLKMVPGFSSLLDRPDVDLSEGERMLRRSEAIINSMTLEERRRPSLLDASRRRRIARGSGTTVQDVNALITQFEQTRKMMKRLKKMGLGSLLKGKVKGKGKARFRFPFG